MRPGCRINGMTSKDTRHALPHQLPTSYIDPAEGPNDAIRARALEAAERTNRVLPARGLRTGGWRFERRIRGGPAEVRAASRPNRRVRAGMGNHPTVTTTISCLAQPGRGYRTGARSWRTL